MPEVTQAPAQLDLLGVRGDPFELVLNVSVTNANGNPVAWSQVTALTAYVAGVSDYSPQAVPLPVLLPTVASTSSGVVTVSWGGNVTQQFDAYADVRWSLSATISGVGPYALLAGSAGMVPSTTPGASTGTTASLEVSVGAATVNLAVRL